MYDRIRPRRPDWSPIVPHIFLDPNLPGITSLLAYRQETAGPLMDLAEVLLRGESTLTRGERELIAAYVSEQNNCEFCAASHGACAAAQLPEGTPLVDQVRADPRRAPIGEKLKALLAIAGSVVQGGWAVTGEQVEEAKGFGATDREIHDTVLIASAFCMYNRYVDGLATVAPQDPNAYVLNAQRLVSQGYAVSGGGDGGSPKAAGPGVSRDAEETARPGAEGGSRPGGARGPSLRSRLLGSARR
jgi:uncharacterized peroxidase-related enzyme